MTDLDKRIAELSAQYLPLAAEILRECIRIPADYVDRPVDDGGDPSCGLSNHEGPRLEYLRQRIIDIGAVRSADDVWFDDYGSLVWTVSDPSDGIAASDKRVVYFDGHTDTVKALRSAWHDKLVGIDAYDGMVDPAAVNRDFLRHELGHLPPDDEWDQLIFGRGAADQLSGVVAEVVATKIALELADEGALHGVIIRAYATACEEDNDGGGPMYLMKEVLPGAPRRDGARRGHPHRGHRRRLQGRARYLPRPARAHADRGHRDRTVVSRLDAVGGAQPARVRRCDHRRGGPPLRRTRRLPR